MSDSSVSLPTPGSTEPETRSMPSEKAAERFEKGSLAFGLSTFQLITVILTLLLTASAAFLGGILYSRQTDVAYSEEFVAFWQAWEIIEEEYYREPPPTQERVYAALEGMVGALNDPNSGFSRPVQAEENREFFSGVFGGIGAIVSQNEQGEVYVVRVMEGNPAHRAGIESGDIIRRVDGNSVAGQSLDEVVELIKGEVGTTVAVTVYRPGEDDELTFHMQRAELERQAVAARVMEDDIGYLYLADFSGVASTQVQREVEALLAENPRALIFDLRGNGGGLLTEALAVADIFLPSGLIMTEQDRGGAIEEFFADNGDAAEDIPLVILVDGGTASAAEVVSGAMQDRGRAVLIGQQTYGKASVQRVHKLAGGGELRITWAAWYTPGQQRIDGVGLAPDIVIEGDQFDEAGEDRVLQQATNYINTHYPPDETEATPAGIDAFFGG